jgi:hypothetical protein
LIAIAALALSQLMCDTLSMFDYTAKVNFETTIQISTFTDTNQNGVQDAGEQVLPNVPIKVDELRSPGITNTSFDSTGSNGVTTFASNYSVSGPSYCPIVTVTITPPAGMVSTSGSDTIEIKDWKCGRDATKRQDKSVSFGLISVAQASVQAAPTLMDAAIAPPTDTPIPTATEIVTPEPVASLKGVVDADQLACRYGPGGVYLYQYGLIKGNPLDVVGRAETADGTWLLVNYGGDRPCWVNAKYVQLQGEVGSLGQVYPEKAPLILFSHPKFPPVSDVEATRSGSQVSIIWEGYELALGDRESADSPRYLVEAWTCQGGQIVFTSYGAFEESALITDEAGCSEPSHGQVFIAHKDGYIGPVAIPWPAQ